MLFRKLWRDLLKNKVQFISIFLMSFLGLYVFVGMDSEVEGGNKAQYSYYEETNLADLWVLGKSFSESDLMRIEDAEGVKNAERRLSVEGKSKDFEDEPTFFLTFLETNEISKIKVFSGESYSAGESGIWIGKEFAAARGLNIGDTIDIEIDNKTITEEIKGLVSHPEYVYFVEDAAAMMPDYSAYCFCFLSSEEYPDTIRYNQIVVDAERIDNSNGLSDYEKDVEAELSGKFQKILDLDTLVVTGKNENISYETFCGEMRQHKSMAIAFSAVFMIISMLGIITTMTRLTANQRIQIGTLKALGFSGWDITLHYVSYGFFLSLAGSVLGAVAGYYTLPDFILGMFTSTYLMPGLKKGVSTGSLACIFAMVAASTLITYYVVRKEGKQPPAETLKPVPPKISKPSAIERSRFWLKLDFSTQWNIRDILRNKIRSLMGTVGVIGAAMLTFAAFGCLDSMNAMMDEAYGRINTANTRIVLSETATYEDAYEYAKKYEGQMIQNLSIEISSDGKKKTGTLRVLDSGNYMHFQNREKQTIEFDRDEIGMSTKMADLLGIERGDFVTWHVIGDDEYYRFRVVQFYQDPSSQGMTMYRDIYESLDRKFVPTEVLTNYKVDKSLSEEDSVTGVQDMNEAMNSMRAMMDMMYTMVAILIFAAVILGVVVLYNLGVLSLVEKMRQMATLKVLGFDTKKIRAILAQQNIWLTVIGIIIGMPTGMSLIKMMFADMPDSMDYAVVVYLPTYVYTFVGTFLLSVAVNRLLSRKISTINMVDALKGQE